MYTLLCLTCLFTHSDDGDDNVVLHDGKNSADLSFGARKTMMDILNGNGATTTTNNSMENANTNMTHSSRLNQLQQQNMMLQQLLLQSQNKVADLEGRLLRRKRHIQEKYEQKQVMDQSHRSRKRRRDDSDDLDDFF